MYKLMIVDDEPLTREYIKRNLTRLHPRWAFGGEAEDGREALQLLDSGEPFDLILTDIKMPAMDGLELARRVSQLPERHIRMAILSGYDEFSLAKEAMRYGVDEYLLKPVVKEELTALLDKIARRLDDERADRKAYQALVALSATSKEQVAQSFLRAVVSENNIETKALYPLLFRLKISLIEAEGAIMLVCLNDFELLQRSRSPSETALYRYILHQTATELAEQSGGTVFFDGDQVTAMLITGEGASDVQHRCRELYRDLAAAILGMTGMNIWGAVGSSEMDVLQLNQSYRKAQQALQYRLFTDQTGLIAADPEDEVITAAVRQLDKTVTAVRSAMADTADESLLNALKSFVGANGISGASRTITFGAYMLERIHRLSRDTGIDETTGVAWTILQQAVSNAPVTPEEAFLLYRRMLQQTGLTTVSAAGRPKASEHEIVTKAKKYIEEHYPEPLSLALIAEKACVTPGYLSSLFHREVNESYIKYLTRIRMEQAALLLSAKPAEKVYDVAEKVGYVSVKHFSYVFKQHFGMPPGEYQAKALA